MTRILIADDHDGTRAVLRVLLQQHVDWEICGEASTGSEALQKTIELKPDVLVKDWVMPGMDNIELAREICKLSPDTAIVNILVSRFAQAGIFGQSCRGTCCGDERPLFVDIGS